eukprot:CAMPEP_0185025892 /NCGR_PEP_ID=MMETSP1103-20130426/9438_1 /TAXON_ID=36769 /ORGANISM="Paraphysomonas bandaiensis, Strain Caron Lab Isolate" /LENGTH=375 /DNA_ID=CAMNT_0027559273 /DNA_START=1 /DNA_END=1128 /DNA_ORIENTATION=+
MQEQKFLFPDIASEYDHLETLHSKKLWHQLSVALDEFLKNPLNHRGDNFYNLYTNFIAPVEARLSQLRLAHIVSMVGHSFDDPARSIEYFTKVLEARTRLGAEASLCIDTDIILMKIKMGLIDDARNLLDDASEKLQASNTNEASVFSKYYKANTEYRKVAGPPEEFYKASLMYLAYTPVESLSEEERFCLATDMALTALTGEGVYNFGEVIATPLLGVLVGSSNQFLHDLVIALNNGDIDAYNSIVESNRDLYFGQDVLRNCHDKIQQKVVLLALMNMVFKRPSHDRTIAYADIAHVARLPLDQVDWVLMRAMSLGLIKGSIDQVDQTVNVTWVQPRVLDKDQVGMLVKQIDGWTEKVKKTLVAVEDQTLELYM